MVKRHRKIFFGFGLLTLVTLALTATAYASDGNAGGGIIEHITLLVFQLSVILFAAWVGRVSFERMRLPSVLGEIIAGVIIGPYCLGQMAFPGFDGGLFPLAVNFPVSVELYSIATLASIILLFFVGLETDIPTFLRYSVAGAVVGLFGVVASFVAGDFAGVLLFRFMLNQPAGFGDAGPIFLGVISTATSVGITARILSDRRKMNSPEGTTILAAAVIDDVLGIIVLAITLGVIRSGQVGWKEISLLSFKDVALWLGFTFLGLRFGRNLSQLLKRTSDRTTMAILAFGLALLLAGVFEKFGLAMIVGAYIMGLTFSKTDLSFILQEKLTMLKSFFVPVFFCVMGMLVNLKEFASPELLAFGLLCTTLAVLGKIVGCGLPALFLNFNFRGASRIGVGMIPRGEVALIIAGIGLSSGIIGNEVFNVAMMMTFATTLITPPVLDKMLCSDKSSLRHNLHVKTDAQTTVFAMPNPETAELLLSKVLATFEEEGFFIHRLDLKESVYQIRKDDLFISLHFTQKQMAFDCSSADLPFVHTLFYEVIADLEHTMRTLETVTDKKLIGKRIFEVGNGKSKGLMNLYIPSSQALSLNLSGKTKEQILDEMVHLVIHSGQLAASFKDKLFNELKERDAVMSTGMQEGIAVFHVKSEVASRVACVAGVCKEGVDFDTLDNKPANIFFLIVAPKAASGDYLQALSAIYNFLADEENRRRILAANSEAEFFDLLKGQQPVGKN